MPTPRIRASTISAEVDPGTFAQLEEKSRQEGSTVAVLVRRIVEKYFETERPVAAKPPVVAQEPAQELPDVRAIRGLLKAKDRPVVSLEAMDESIGRLLAADDLRIRKQAAG
jgi:hypothetical protein